MKYVKTHILDKMGKPSLLLENAISPQRKKKKRKIKKKRRYILFSNRKYNKRERRTKHQYMISIKLHPPPPSFSPCTIVSFPKRKTIIHKNETIRKQMVIILKWPVTVTKILALSRKLESFFYDVWIGILSCLVLKIGRHVNYYSLFFFFFFFSWFLFLLLHVNSVIIFIYFYVFCCS